MKRVRTRQMLHALIPSGASLVPAESTLRTKRRGEPRRRRHPFPGFLSLFVALAATALAATSEPANPPSGVSFEQRIGEQLPLDATLVDTSGTPRKLGAFFHHQPVVLYFGYARCPQLCSVVADGTVEVLRHLARSVGPDLQVVTISIDPLETTADARATEALAIRRYGRTEAASGWHYLTADERTIGAVADAAGFHFRYDPASREYAHASGFLIATPDGRISRYFLGVDFVATDVASAIQRAAVGQTGESIYDLLLLCFHGGAIGGRYGVLIWRTLVIAVVLTVIALFGGIGWMLYQERRARSAGREAT